MTQSLSKEIRIAAKGLGWSVKRDILSRRCDDMVLAVHPHRGTKGVIEFRAKPVEWDQTLWSILQIEGNEAMPTSFHFTGAFTCDCPALIQENTTNSADKDIAKNLVELSARALRETSTWQSYKLIQAIACEIPQQPYRYHMTHVVDRICQGDFRTAEKTCTAALNGDLDVRHTFSSVDKLSPPDGEGRRESLSFFRLAELWISRR